MLKDRIIKLPKEVRELDINMSFYDVIKGLGLIMPVKESRY